MPLTTTLSRSAAAVTLLLVAGSVATAAPVAVGAGTGDSAVRVVSLVAADPVTANFLAYPAPVGGVRVAQGDIDGDGIADVITGTGMGASAHVKVFSGATNTEVSSFFAFPIVFTGGVNVAAGDVDGDGRADIVAGAGAGGGPQVRVFSGSSGAELQSFFAFAPAFSGGVRVAAGDVDGDGRADIVAGAGPGAGPSVSVFSGADGSLLRSFLAFAPAFSGGVHVAAGDLDGDGLADIVVGTDAGGGPNVSVFSGADGSLLQSFFAFAPAFSGGVRVAVGDLDGDGLNEIIAGAGEGGSQVSIFNGQTGALRESFSAFSPSFTGGFYVSGIPFIPAPGAAAFLAALGLAVTRRRR